MSGSMSAANRFRGDDRGSVAFIFAMSLVVLMLLIGLAVDTARYQDIATRMQSALDGASLAAAKLLSDESLSDSDLQERANAYFQAATQTFGVRPSSVAPLVIAIDRAKSSVEVAGRIDVPTLFGGFADLPTLTVLNQKSKVVYDMTSVELSMVLDITGSMNSNNKLADMKVAANEVVDILFDGALNDGNVRIALAPYSAAVNAGSLAAAVAAVPPPEPCPYKKGDSKNCKTSDGADMDTCVIERTGINAATDAAPVGANALPTMTSPSFGHYKCPPSIILPLQDRTARDQLKATINGYAADGATAGHIGTAWGWYLISPEWSSVLPPESAPKPYGGKLVQKNMIVMTDGEFNTSYTGAGDQAAESYAYFDNLCAGAKAAGINIYTVGFDLNAPEALAHLESCASAPEMFYDAKTGAQLKDAFKDIANKLGNLRVAS